MPFISDQEESQIDRQIRESIIFQSQIREQWDILCELGYEDASPSAQLAIASMFTN